jgi:capsular polysaccharide biosynthesis protein/Mrp family chromosome partitioning ATPase
MSVEAADSPRLGDYVDTLRRRRGTIVLTAFVVVGTALVVSFLRAPRYEATATVVVSPGADTTIDAEVLVAESDAVRADARKALGFPASIEVVAAPGSNEVAVVGHSRNADTAAKIANGFAAAYVADRPSSASAGTATVAHLATAPHDPVEPDPIRNALVGLFVGLLAGLALALTFEYAGGRVQGRRDISRALGATPVLGTIPLDNGYRAAAMQDVASLTVPTSRVSTAYRAVRADLDRAVLGRTGRTLLVTAPRRGAGTATVAANLAVAFANAGHRVVLLGTDPAAPELAELFDVPEATKRLGDVVTGAAPLSAAEHTLPSLGALAVVPPGGEGSASPPTARVAEVLAAVRVHADVVVLAGPDVLAGAAGPGLAGLCESTVLIAAAGLTRGRDLRRAGQALLDVGADLRGVVLVDDPTAPGAAEGPSRLFADDYRRGTSSS